MGQTKHVSDSLCLILKEMKTQYQNLLLRKVLLLKVCELKEKHLPYVREGDTNGQGRLTVYKFNTPPLYKKVDNYSNLCCGDDRGLSRKESGADSNDSRPKEVCLHYIRSVGDLKFYSICFPFVFSAQGSPAEFNCVMFNGLVHIWQ